MSEDKRPNPIDILVGARVRAIRKARGYSQASLAERLGLTFQQVQKYETGATRMSTSRLVEISQSLSLNPAELMAGLSGEGTNLPIDFDFDIFTENGTVELLRSYTKLSARDRRAVVGLARVLAADDDPPGAES